MRFFGAQRTQSLHKEHKENNKQWAIGNGQLANRQKTINRFNFNNDVFSH